MKIRSKSSAVRIIKHLFVNNNEDTVSLEDAFRAWGRKNPEDINLHKSWISNVMYHLKYHNLVTPLYSFGDGPRKLKGMRLTLEGKRMLGRVSDTEDDRDDFTINRSIVQIKSSNNPTSSSDIFQIVADFQKSHLEYEITFDMKLRNDKG